MNPMRIGITANTTWNLCNFRKGLIDGLIAHGHEVVAYSPSDGYEERLIAEGIPHHAITMNAGGTSPLEDGGTILAFRRAFVRTRPDVLLTYTAKSNIYGGMAAHSLGIPVVPNVAGLGTPISSGGALGSVVKQLYRMTLGSARHVFFQNREDLELFMAEHVLRHQRTSVLPGSGIDLDHFHPGAAPPSGGDCPFRFLMMGRLLRDKGFGEYAAAARMVKREVPNARFAILGLSGGANPNAIPAWQVDEWAAEGAVEYLGGTDDVRPHVAAADCVVLPSYYREGTPHSLLEAAAMGKPIVTTDWIGCRNAVQDGVSGFLARPRDAADLADKLVRVTQLSPEARRSMGEAGRRLMRERFDQRIVIDRYLEALAGTPEPQPAEIRQSAAQ